MIKLKKLLKESMTLYVDSADYKRYDNLIDLSGHLETLAYRELGKLPKDQQDYYSRNRPSDLLTIDGTSDIYSPTGVLNLYYSGYTTATLKKILKVVLDELKKLNIGTGKIKMEDSKAFAYKVIRLPIVKNDNKYNGAPEVNMSNRNAYHIFHNILQFEPDDEYNASFHFTATELKDAVESILKHDPDWIKSNQIHKTDSAWPDAEKGDDVNPENPHDDILKGLGGSGARIVNMGLNDEEIKSRLYRCLDLANWAIKHNKKELYVA